MRISFLKKYASAMTRLRRASDPQAPPAGVEDARREVEGTIARVCANLSPRRAFGYHTVDDIYQEAYVLCLEVIRCGKYDPRRPLENFLHVHVANRLGNMYRKQMMRCEPPCGCCEPFGEPEEPCRKWREWKQRNAAKSALMCPGDVSSVPEDRLRGSESVTDEASLKETLSRLDRAIPASLRADYLRMRAGVPVAKSRAAEIRLIATEVIGDGRDV